MRIYKVTFMEYTNAFLKTACNKDIPIGEGNKFIDTEYGFLFVKEKDLETIKHWGNGLNTMEYIGELWEGI